MFFSFFLFFFFSFFPLLLVMLLLYHPRACEFKSTWIHPLSTHSCSCASFFFELSPPVLFLLLLLLFLQKKTPSFLYVVLTPFSCVWWVCAGKLTWRAACL